VEKEAKGEVGKAPNAAVGNLQAEIETAEANLKAMTSGRHKPFFDYGVLLASAGYDRSQIEIKLREVAGSNAEMRKKVIGVLKSLANYGWF
jgi:hypothetical protein